MLDKLNNIANEARQANSRFHKTARTAYEFVRAHHADPKYDAFRTSERGRDWKKQKLVECQHRCPECHKLMNGNNASIDHKHPRRHYPWLAWDVNNLWVLCLDCNKRKSNMEWDVYLAMVREMRGQSAVDRILKYAPPTSLDR